MGKSVGMGKLNKSANKPAGSAGKEQSKVEEVKQAESQEQAKPEETSPNLNKVEAHQEQNPEAKQIPTQTEKNKGGRPKRRPEPYHKYNFNLSDSVYQKMLVRKKAFDNDMTKYVETIIKRDLELHYEETLAKYGDQDDVW